MLLFANDNKLVDIVNLAGVITNEMSPYSDRAVIDGPRVLLAVKAAQNFALAVHELATNAAKYGALSR